MTLALDYQPAVSSFAGRDLDSLIGNTPLIGFQRITAHLPADVIVAAKAEWVNPGGSIKDRAAANIIRQAERTGDLRPGKVILDSTSGNTGIAYAMLGAAKGYRVKLFVPGNASPERIAILKAYGAELELTDPLEGSDGAIRAVRELAAAEPETYFYADQYNNPANWQAHYNSTGIEIWDQTGGGVTHFVAGLGTSGTLMGTGRRLKAYNPDVQVDRPRTRLAVSRAGRSQAHADRHQAGDLRRAFRRPDDRDRHRGDLRNGAALGA